MPFVHFCTFLFSSFGCSSALSFLVLAMHYYTLRDRCQHGVARLPRPAPSNLLPDETVKDHGGLPCHLRGHKTLHNSVDEALLLKRKSEEVLFYLNERWFATAAE